MMWLSPYTSFVYVEDVDELFAILHNVKPLANTVRGVPFPIAVATAVYVGVPLVETFDELSV